MIKNIYLILLLLSPLFNQSFAQSNLSESKAEELTELGVYIEGTYQIQMIDTRALPAVELSLYEIIEAKRDLNNTVYHYVGSNMRIMILPKEIIEHPDFISLENIKYISSKNIEDEK